MHRRLFVASLLGAALLAPANALDLSDLTNKDASAGLRTALTQGAEKAVGQLGVTDGFFGNNQVKIGLPDSLAKAEGMMRRFGMGKMADDLTLTMNRAAESAVVEAKPLLVDAIKKMTLADAKSILSGPEDAATQYFRKTSGEALTARFLPKVQAATAKVKLAERYNQFAGQASRFGLLSAEDANLDQYITRKTLDGLFVMVAQQEKTIRQDPMGQASSILKKVFGASGLTAGH